MNRKNLSLDGKMKVIDYANKNPSGMSGDCRTFQYWKDLRLKYLKERKILQREYEIFKGNCIKLRHGQYHLINEILIAW